MELAVPKSIHLGRLAGLEIQAQPSALVSFTLLWAVLSVLGAFLLHLLPLSALFGGFAGAVLHYASELWHNLGHAAAAQRSGHPMTGVVFWGLLAASRYPANEGVLPAKVHIQRALGGPIISAILAVLVGLFYLIRSDAGSHLGGWLTLFLFADNLLIFTLGSLLPLGFTDGSTLLRWWGKP